MKLKFFISSVFISLLVCSCNINNQNNIQTNELEIWDNEASKIWEDYYPIGNGRLGAMPSGDVYKETVVLNDITMWSGSYDSTQQNLEAKKYLPKIRTLLQRGKNKEAQDLVYKHFLCGGKGSGQAKGADIPFGTYQILGNLKIEHDIVADSIKNYRRGLSLKDAVAYTSFSIKNTEYRREYFVSHSDDVIIIKLSSNKSNKIGFTLSLNRPQRYFTYVTDNDLYMEGELNSGQKNVEGVRYKTRIKVLHEDGLLEQVGKNLKLQKATSAYIIISSSTNMLDSAYEKTVDDLLANAEKIPYEKLKNKHIEAYQEKFNRVELNLADNDNSLPTKQRLSDFQ
ncbi:MAG: glycoside hydrolase family 95 protein, partial [Paludibacteraceae bacterium]|nr:glycoside hydrolase family 95 protein [Paludibacteraceae bacterium]